MYGDAFDYAGGPPAAPPPARTARCYGCGDAAPPAAPQQPAWCARCVERRRDARERDAAR